LTADLGRDGVGLGYAIASASGSPGSPVVAVEGDSAFGSVEWRFETILSLSTSNVVIVFNPTASSCDDLTNYSTIPRPTVFTKVTAMTRLIEAFGGTGYQREDSGNAVDRITTGAEARTPALIIASSDPTAGTESGHLKASTRRWDFSKDERAANFFLESDVPAL